MTVPVKGADLASAYAALDPLCAKVGLTGVDQLAQIADVPAAPEGIALWSSSYARLLLWPCTASDAATIATTAHAAQRWFDEVLIASERRAGRRPIDGYLVLALPKPPEDEAREDVRRLDLSAQVCRKHLIWPSLNEGRDYLSVKLDDPSFPAPIYATLVQVEGESDLQLIWSRPNRD